MVDYLHFASKAPVSSDSIEIIVKGLIDYEPQIDVKNAKSIVWSLTDLVSNSNSIVVLLNKAFNELVIYMDQLTMEEIETTLTKLTNRYNLKHPYYYDEVFYDSCANYVIEQDLGFKNAIYILRKLARVVSFVLLLNSFNVTY